MYVQSPGQLLYTKYHLFIFLFHTFDRCFTTHSRAFDYNNQHYGEKKPVTIHRFLADLTLKLAK